MTLHDDKDRPQHQQPAEPAPDPNPAPDPDPAEQRKEAADTAPPNPLIPVLAAVAQATGFLLHHAMIQNPDLTKAATDHIRNIHRSLEPDAPPAPAAKDNHEQDEHGNAIRQSKRFRSRG